jgi:putative phosphotransacetylase
VQWIEHLVRQAVYQRLGKPLPRGGRAPNPLVVNVQSARATATSRRRPVEALFGKGHSSRRSKWLYQEGPVRRAGNRHADRPAQPGHFQSPHPRPCRDLNQVELAYTDAIALGFDFPCAVRQHQGHARLHADGAGGFFEMPRASSAPRRHVHMHPTTRVYGVKAGDFMKLRVGGPCGITFRPHARARGPDFKLEVHIDTDEGNACGLQPGHPGRTPQVIPFHVQLSTLTSITSNPQTQ